MSLETLALTIIESMIGAASSMMLTSTVRGGLRPIRTMSDNEARDADSASLASLFGLNPSGLLSVFRSDRRIGVRWYRCWNSYRGYRNEILIEDHESAAATTGAKFRLVVDVDCIDSLSDSSLALGQVSDRVWIEAWSAESRVDLSFDFLELHQGQRGDRFGCVRTARDR